MVREWWRSGVLYQIYPRSFADADGDGVGDLQGIIDHLDHLEWLGIDGMWLSPLTPPPHADDDHPLLRPQGFRPVYNMNRPEVHEVFRRWRSLVDADGPDRVLLGETWVLDLQQLVRFYGSGTDQLHLAINFPFVFADFGPAMRSVVEAAEAGLPPGAWSAWHGSSHDAGRFPTRWCDDDRRRIGAAMVTLLTLRGTPILYYGDEIGMTEVAVPRDRLRDAVGIRGWPEDPGRDPARTSTSATSRCSWPPGATSKGAADLSGWNRGRPWCSRVGSTESPGLRLNRGPTEGGHGGDRA